MTDIVDWLRAYANRTTVIDIKRLDEAAAEIERLRAALATVLGTATHGQNMTWVERIKIGRAALEGK